jgi:hypothetical protein
MANEQDESSNVVQRRAEAGELFSRTTLTALNLLSSISNFRRTVVRPGDFVQTKSYVLNDDLPKRVFFNMALRPVPPTINVNVNQ